MREAIKGYSGEVFDLFCGNDLLWDSNHCKKVTKNLPVDSKNKKPLSVLPIVLEMMERFWVAISVLNQFYSEHSLHPLDRVVHTAD